MSAENVTLTSRTEQHIAIKHCVSVGMIPLDTHMFVYMAKLKPNCSMVSVFRWHNIFSDGCDDIGDRQRSARPKIITENDVKSIWGKPECELKENSEINDFVNLKWTVVHYKMKEYLNLSIY